MNRIFPALLACCLLASCASRESVFVSQPPAVVCSRFDAKEITPPVKASPARRSRPKAQLTPQPPAPTPTPKSRVKKPAPTPKPTPRSNTTTVISLLGTVYEATEDGCIQLRGARPKAGGTALFEDAIILGRLRARLQAEPKIPASLSASTTMQGGQARFLVPTGTSLAQQALAVRVALDTTGVRKVRLLPLPEKKPEAASQ